jgi:hypothetical protein
LGQCRGDGAFVNDTEKEYPYAGRANVPEGVVEVNNNVDSMAEITVLEIS